MTEREQKMAALRRQYLAELPATARRLRSDFRRLSAGELEAYQQLTETAHQLAGNAGFFELMPVADQAQKLDSALQRAAQIDDYSGELPATVERLAAMLEAAAAENPAPPA